MNIVTVYGDSDDRTEVEGAIREEFVEWPPGKRKISFSDGSYAVLDYDDEGIWRVIETEHHEDYGGVEVAETGTPVAANDYSEVAVFRWIDVPDLDGIEALD